MVGLNFTGTGGPYLNIYVLNDTDWDGNVDDEVLVWDGSSSPLSSTNYIYLNETDTYLTDGGTSRVKVMIKIPETDVGLDGQSEIRYDGSMYLWFTSATF